MTDRSCIRVKAMAVLRNATGTHHLVLRWRDETTGEDVHRLLGGGVEVGERTRDAGVREIAEELGATLLEPRLLGVVEEIFDFEGRPGREVVIVYPGRLAEGDHVPPDGATYADDGVPMPVEWRPLDDAGVDLPLYPEGCRPLLQ